MSVKWFLRGVVFVFEKRPRAASRSASGGGDARVDPFPSGRARSVRRDACAVLISRAHTSLFGLFIPQRHHGIETRSAMRGNEACGQSQDGEKQNREPQGQRIARLQPEQKRTGGLAGCKC